MNCGVEMPSLTDENLKGVFNHFHHVMSIAILRGKIYLGEIFLVYTNILL